MVEVAMFDFGPVVLPALAVEFIICCWKQIIIISPFLWGREPRHGLAGCSELKVEKFTKLMKLESS